MTSPKAKIIKRPLVLWSGGFDSTALVIEKLQVGDIDIMYVNLDNNQKMQRREKKALVKLKCLIKNANLPGRIINEYDFGYQEITVAKAVFAQPALWLQSAVFSVDPTMHSEVNIAYVKYDDAWHYKTEILNAYNALAKLVCYDDAVVPLNFPFEWRTKAEILESLEDFVYTKQVMKLIYYCEAGEKTPCGECGSCKRHNNELSYD